MSHPPGDPTPGHTWTALTEAGTTDPGHEWDVLVHSGLLDARTPIAFTRAPRPASADLASGTPDFTGTAHRWHLPVCPEVPHHADRTQMIVPANRIAETLRTADRCGCLDAVYAHPDLAHLSATDIQAAIWLGWAERSAGHDPRVWAGQLRWLLLTRPRLVSDPHLTGLVADRAGRVRDLLATVVSSPDYHEAVARHLAHLVAGRAAETAGPAGADPAGQHRLPDPAADPGTVRAVRAALDQDRRHRLGAEPPVPSSTWRQLADVLTSDSCWVAVTSTSFETLRNALDVTPSDAAGAVARIPTVVALCDPAASVVVITDGATPPGRVAAARRLAGHPRQNLDETAEALAVAGS